MDANWSRRRLHASLVVCANRTRRPITCRTSRHLMSRGRPEGCAATQGDSAVQLAHVGWPWVDAMLGVLAQEQKTHRSDPKDWQSRAGVSFGRRDDWQLSRWQRARPSVEAARLFYGSEGFWLMDPEEYRESYLPPQLWLFETATTNGHGAEEGSPERKQLRQDVFYDNAWDSWCAAVRESQAKRGAQTPLAAPAAAAGAGSA